MATKVEMDPIWKKIAYSALPKVQANAWCSLTTHFLTYKGKEWTAGRGKALWNVANLHRSGQLASAREVLQSNRIAYDSTTALPKGVEGAIVLAYARSKKPSSVRRLAAVMRGYTSIRLSHPSTEQVEKARNSINGEYLGVPFDEVTVPYHYPRKKPGESAEHYRARAPRNAVLHLPGSHFGMWPKMKDGTQLRLPPITELSGISRYPAPVRLPKGLKEKPFSHMLVSLLTMGYVPLSLRRCYSQEAYPEYDRYGKAEFHPDFRLRIVAERALVGKVQQVPLGKIVVLQEGGAKGRVICSPTAWIQLYMMPLHKKLASTIKSLENSSEAVSHGISCMFNQVRGVDYARKRMSDGGFVAAVDLSSATDRFPLYLQQVALQELGLMQYAVALNDLRGPYKGPDGKPWYYNTGQPMGLYGSFPLFHLTHWAFLEAAAIAVFGPDRTGEPKYAVLGDDVLLFDRRLAVEYRKRLQHFGVPVSGHKCYQGDNTEFAGFFISKRQDAIAAFRPFKYGSGLNALALCHALGGRVRKWGPWFSRAFAAYQATLSSRDLSLEPLFSEKPDPWGRGGSPGMAYFGALLTQLRWTVRLPEAFYDSIEAWDKSSYALLQVEEKLSDIGHSGISTGDGFTPETYIASELERRSSDQQMRRHFSADPLVRAYRKALLEQSNLPE